MMIMFIKRMMAFVCDSIILVGLFFLVGEIIDLLFSAYLKDVSNVVIITMKFAIMFLISYISLFIIQLLIGASIGKWLLNLKIVAYHNSKPSSKSLLLRELLKLIIIPSCILFIIVVVTYFTDKVMWYDKVLGLDVIKKKGNQKELNEMFRR